MSKTETEYIIVKDGDPLAVPRLVAGMLDDGWTLVVSWATNNAVHHILSRDKTK